MAPASTSRWPWEARRPKRASPTPTSGWTDCDGDPEQVLPRDSRWMVGDFHDMRPWRVMPKGGHFAAFEQPALFVDDVRAFFRLVR